MSENSPERLEIVSNQPPTSDFVYAWLKMIMVTFSDLSFLKCFTGWVPGTKLTSLEQMHAKSWCMYLERRVPDDHHDIWLAETNRFSSTHSKMATIKLDNDKLWLADTQSIDWFFPLALLNPYTLESLSFHVGAVQWLLNETQHIYWNPLYIHLIG
jgi:hypothetical protein